MVNFATAALDLTDQTEVARILPQVPLVESDRTEWQGLTFRHYCHPPHETIEHCLRQHSLVVTAAQSHFQAERYLDGKLSQYTHGGGRVDIIPALLDHHTNWKQSAEFSVIALCPTLLDQIAQTSASGEVELIPQIAIRDPIIQQLALALKLEIQTGCLSGRLFGESLATAIATRLVQNYAASKPEFSASGLPASQLKRVFDYMQANLAQDISVLDLATLTNMSQSHFSRSFKRSVGTSPYRYLMQQRVERAKQLLKARSHPISIIALDCGFANQTHLTKVFRQLTGTTPKAYSAHQRR